MMKTLSGQQQLEEELRGFKDILSVAQVVVSSLELDEVLANILASAMAVMEMPAGSIALYDRANNTLKLHAHQGLSETFTARSSWTVKEGGLTSMILSMGELYIAEDTHKNNMFTGPLAIAEGIRCLIAVPLKIQNKVVGTLYLNDFVPRTFSDIRLRLLSILGSFASMSIDNARLHERTKELACTDSLTGLYNRRWFQKLFSDELQRARRYEKAMSLIMFDIDDFKQFNDIYGHPVGDKVLIRVAEIMTNTLRDGDSIFRYGGEEFIAILPEADLAEALTVAERVRERIARESGGCLEGEGRNNVTVSVGVASYPRDGQTMDDLVKKVDSLLYIAKRQGKNLVHHFPG